MHDIHDGMFASFKEPAWHSIGTVFTDPLTASEATALAGMDYQVAKVPHEIWHEGVLLDTVYDLVRLPHREQDAAYFGTVGTAYEVLDNVDIALILDPLSGRFPVETVGALGGGKTVFWTFKTGTFQVKGEEIAGHILVTEGKDGKGGLKIVVTPVRVVCQNTLTMGLRSGTVTAAVSHSHSPASTLEFWSDTLPRVEAAERSAREALNMLAETKITKAQVDLIINAAYPMPRASSKAALRKDEGLYAELPDGLRTQVDKASAHNDYYVGRARGFRQQAHALFDVFNQEFPKTAMTAWAAANAVAEHEDHRRTSGESRGSAIFGDRQRNKERAFAEAFKIAGVK